MNRRDLHPVAIEDPDSRFLTPGFHRYLHCPQAFVREPRQIEVHQPLQHEGCREYRFARI